MRRKKGIYVAGRLDFSRSILFAGVLLLVGGIQAVCSPHPPAGAKVLGFKRNENIGRVFIYQSHNYNTLQKGEAHHLYWFGVKGEPRHLLQGNLIGSGRDLQFTVRGGGKGDSTAEEKSCRFISPENPAAGCQLKLNFNNRRELILDVFRTGAHGEKTTDKREIRYYLFVSLQGRTALEFW